MFGLRKKAKPAPRARLDLETLYMEAQPKLLRYVTGVLNGDVELAADVVDDAFVAYWQKADKDEIENPLAWLRRVARNKAIDAIRKNREVLGASDSAEKEALDLADDAISADAQVEANQQREGIVAAMDKLSADHREVLWLCYFEEQSIDEIAQIVGISPNTVKTRLFHGRKTLKTHLERSRITL